MSYQALYRKWRPKVFEEVIGQGHVVNTLKNQIINKSVGHAYLFSGIRGTGKTSTAKIFARAINCLNSSDGNPCNKCENCKQELNDNCQIEERILVELCRLAYNLSDIKTPYFE